MAILITANSLIAQNVYIGFMACYLSTLVSGINVVLTQGGVKTPITTTVIGVSMFLIFSLDHC